MNINKITTSMVSVVSGSLFLLCLVPLVANAETQITANTSAIGVATHITAPASTTSDIRDKKISARSDSAINLRIDDLNKLNNRIQTMRNVTVAEKTAFSSEVQTNINGLTALKTKIDADTVTAITLADEKSIFTSYRIYALVIPQGYIIASADRVNTIVEMMTVVSAKLAVRIANEQAAGKNVSPLQTSLTDLNLKIADAKIQALAIVTKVSTLVPDQGDKAQLEANTATLKSARSTMKLGRSDLESARVDIRNIIKGLKVLSMKANVAATTTIIIK
jgi:hypothetical protein